MTRPDVELEIGEDEAAVEVIAQLLERRTKLEAWSDTCRQALASSLSDDGTTPAERWKVVALKRHLFGAAEIIPDDIAVSAAMSTRDLRVAERLRSNLTSRLPFRAGIYLLPRV